MYFADPDQGSTRRAMFKQRAQLWARRTEDLVVNEPLATSEAMLDLRDVVSQDTPDLTLVEVVTIEGDAAPLPVREPISDETMTVDEALFHAARTL
jgi:hypothetical protein